MTRLFQPLIPKRTQQGFTLIELMIAMLLGLVVSGAAVVIVISALSQLRSTRNFADIVDNGRVVLALMGQDISHAGFFGELSGQTLVVGSNLTLQATNPISDCEGAGLNNRSLPQAGAATTFRLLWGQTVASNKPMDCIASDAKIGSDLIQVKRLIGREDTTAAADASNNNRVFMLTNAASAILYNNATSGAPSGTLPANGQYYEYQNRVYYVAQVSRYGQADFPVLVRQSLQVVNGRETMVAEEIAEGVDDLRILYGVDTNGDFAVDHYVQANQVSDAEWDGVADTRLLSIQIALLMRAIDVDASFRSAGAQTYKYAGESQTLAADGIRRKVLMRTFSLRNYQLQGGL